MKIACSILERAIGSSFPNPTVASLIIESDKNYMNNQIKSFGITNKGGRPHAEYNAISKTNFLENKFYTIYTTMEPCCHKGRDISCVDKIKSTKISRVVYSIKDPDRRTNGRGEELLKKYGIDVKSGVLKKKISKLYEGYLKNKKLNRPKVTLKMASSMDGKISSCKGKKSQITNRLSQRIVHKLRSTSDAILIGCKTLKIDNPKLNCRFNGLNEYSPIRVILCSKLDLRKNMEIFKDCKKYKTIFFTSDENEKNLTNFSKKNIQVFSFKKNKYNLKSILKKLSEIGVYNLLVEGGSEIFTSFLKEDFCDEIFLFQSNFFIGEKGKTILNAKNFDFMRNRFKLRCTSILDDNLFSIFEK